MRTRSCVAIEFLVGMLKIAAVIVTVIVVLALIVREAGASELEHSRAWCESVGGQAEVRLDDGTRADCLTLGYAIEVDWASKWPQGVGQAVHYARVSGRLPGILLLAHREGACRYVERARSALRRVHYYATHGPVPIRLWVVPECP